MEKLWAPWRMQYVEVKAPEGCIFCTKPKDAADADNLILHRGQTAFVILNAFPYNNGHLMVVPYRHTADLTDLTAEERDELMALAQWSTRLLKSELRPDGFNMGMNLGAWRALGSPIIFI